MKSFLAAVMASWLESSAGCENIKLIQNKGTRGDKNDR